jgi:hypothetical protein
VVSISNNSAASPVTSAPSPTPISSAITTLQETPSSPSPTLSPSPIPSSAVSANQILPGSSESPFPKNVYNRIEQKKVVSITNDYRQLTFTIFYNEQGAPVDVTVIDPEGQRYTHGDEYLYGENLYTVWENTYRILRFEQTLVKKGDWVVITKSPEGVELSINGQGLPI